MTTRMTLRIKSRTRQRRRLSLDHLEDRAIPAVDLSTAGLPITAAYSTFAANVRTVEATLNTAPADPEVGGTPMGGLPTEGTGGTEGTEGASSSTITAGSVGSAAVSGVLTLESALKSSFSSDPAAAFLTQQSLDANGLGGRLASVFAASSSGTPDGTVPKSSLPLLYTAVEGAMFQSYQSTSVNQYLSAITPPAASGTPIAGAVAVPTVTPTASPTATTVAAQVQAQLAALMQNLSVSLQAVPTATTLIGGELGSSGLGTELAAIFAAAGSQTTDTSISQGMLPLLFTAVDASIAASLQSAVNAVYLDDSGQATTPSSSLDSLLSTLYGNFSLFTTNVRAIEAALVSTSGSTSPGIGTPVTTPAIALSGFTQMASTTATATGTFQINLSAVATSTVTVAYSTVDGTAVAGTDYTATSGTLTFAPGTTSATVPVTLLASSATSGNKAFTLALSNPTNATLSTTSATGTITYGTGTGSTTADVTLTPKAEEGPFFQDFTDSTLDRSNVVGSTTRTSVTTAIPLALALHVYEVSGTTVTPLTGARVDIWNADAAGVYSDEASEGTTGETYLRGYQFTDSSGAASFTTIFPGWYSGRTPHVHFMVRTGDTTLTNRITSQFFFDQSTINTVDTTVSPYSTRGVPDTTNASDRVYNTTTTSGASSGSLLTLTLTGSATAGYTASYNIYVAANS